MNLYRVLSVFRFHQNHNSIQEADCHFILLELIADALDININWLMGENAPMENSSATDNQTTGYVFYKEMEYLLNNTDTAYIGFQTQYGALIPRYQIYVNVSLNEMHIVPIFLREDSKEYYQYPKELTQPESYEIFTRDFMRVCTVRLANLSLHHPS